MYIKGDRTVNCQNQECMQPASGWQLTFELF
jgi:hypothetical protein